jgi:hypothetical protein
MKLALLLMVCVAKSGNLFLRLVERCKKVRTGNTEKDFKSLSLYK